MRTTLVMTVMGPDRPGLVELLARTVVEQGGNWLESQMARLGGQFAGILRVEVDAERAADLGRALRELRDQDLTVHWQTERVVAEAREATLAQLELVGQDRPGIVRQISRVLASRSVNVEALETTRRSAPMSGETLFAAQATLRLPPDCPLEALRADLETIAADLMVDLTFGWAPTEVAPPHRMASGSEAPSGKLD